MSVRVFYIVTLETSVICLVRQELVLSTFVESRTCYSIYLQQHLKSILSGRFSLDQYMQRAYIPALHGILMEVATPGAGSEDMVEELTEAQQILSFGLRPPVHVVENPGVEERSQCGWAGAVCTYVLCSMYACSSLLSLAEGFCVHFFRSEGYGDNQPSGWMSSVHKCRSHNFPGMVYVGILLQ